MLTPFTDSGDIDLEGLRSLVDFYIENRVSGLFATCLSSEIHHLSPDEVLLLCRKTVEYADGRVPVAAGIPQTGDIPEIAGFVRKIRDEGVCSVVVTTCQIAGERESDDLWRLRMETLLAATGDIPLGTYECPVPYKRVLSPALFEWLAETGRINFHKDTCSDLGQIQAKLAISKNSSIRFFNANLPTLVGSLLAGGDGYSGVDTNFFPELCVWLVENHRTAPGESIRKAVSFLENALETYGRFYPRSSKIFLRMRGVDIADHCRTQTPTPTPEELQQLESLLREHQRNDSPAHPAAAG